MRKVKCTVNPWRDLNNRASNVHIGNLLSRELAADQEFHRPMLFKLLWAVRLLGKQGLAFRGHNKSSEAFQGNLYQLLLMQAEDCPKMNAWLQKREYISPKITNELIKAMGQKIFDDIRGEIIVPSGMLQLLMRPVMCQVVSNYL